MKTFRKSGTEKLRAGSISCTAVTNSVRIALCLTRGKERSRRPEEIIQEVRSLASEGYKEITLLGQNVNAYGKDFEDMTYGLGDLMDELRKSISENPFYNESSA